MSLHIGISTSKFQVVSDFHSPIFTEKLVHYIPLQFYSINYYGQDQLLWTRSTFMDNINLYRQDQLLWTRSTFMDKINVYGQDQRLWTRSTLMEKINFYGQD